MASRSIVRMPPASAAGGPKAVSAGADGLSVAPVVDGIAVSPSAMRFGLAGPGRAVYAALVTRPVGQLAGKGLAVHPLGQMVLAGERGEAGHRAIELQFDRTGRAMALLADDNFRLAGDLVAFRHPGGELVAIALQRLAHLMIVLFAVDEQHDVRVLLDRAGLAQVG